ncbi:MAG TPA: hypothetical protein PLO63_08805 [Syntrophales bacterium]|nr:hypothetical protein [Syntrophales bacterium]
MHISTLDRYGSAVDQATKEASVSSPSGETKSRGSTQAAAEGGQPHLLLRQAEAIDAIFQEASSKLDQMKDSLHGIFKTYPPYPPGSQERAEKLQRYDALRRQIEQLRPAVIREEAEKEEKSVSVSLPTTQKIWDLAFDEQGRIRTVSTDEASSTGNSGDAWQFPVLAENAPDQKIRDTADRIDQLSNAVQRKRSEFWSFLEPYALTDLYA